jgi:hypothetical protein
MTHICPACGEQWECVCAEQVKWEHVRLLGAHEVEIACSEQCALQLGALLVFLTRYRG